MQEILNELLSLKYINEIFIAVGVLLVLFGLLKIVRNGLQILLWVLLTVLGAYGVAYGLDHSSNNFTVNLQEDLGAIVEPGKDFITDKLQNVCRSLNLSDNAQFDIILPAE